MDRNRVPVPPSLAIGGARERDEAIAFYAERANAQEPFRFKAYKAPDVVAALGDLFRGKCAYCESPYAAVSPADVEHFRPKGAVTIESPSEPPRLSKPGYYWLAADWENLLASCNDCNRPRRHELPDAAGEEGAIVVRGKANRFPLRDEQRRGRRPGEERVSEQGQRLLIDPCSDDPDEYLEFGTDGLVRARENDDGPCPVGLRTIDVLALRRPGLNRARGGHLRLLVERMDELLPFVERLDGNARDRQAAREVEKRIRRLRQMAGAAQPYAGMKRQFIRAFEASLADGSYRAFVYRLLREVPCQEAGDGDDGGGWD